MAEKKGTISTRYDTPTGGTLAFTRNAALEPEIMGYLETVRQLQEDYAAEPHVMEALRRVESGLQSLRIAEGDEAALRKRLAELVEVPVTPDRNIRLDAFRRTSARGPASSEESYLAQAEKLVRNTRSNTVLLLLNNPGDTVLERFLQKLQAIKFNDYRGVKQVMGEISQSPQLWHYNERKKAFLLDWLKPYEAELGKPVSELSGEELAAALRQVEGLRDKRLEEMTHLTVEHGVVEWRPHNRESNPLINGRDDAFWGGLETRDEFVALLTRLVTRFSFDLEERFQVFKTKDGGFAYLVGFADDAFDSAIATEDGKLALYPHLKVFVRAGEDYRELTQAAYGDNRKAYYTSLRTAVVPFLKAVGIMVEMELSEELKGAFDMWV